MPKTTLTEHVPVLASAPEFPPGFLAIQAGRPEELEPYREQLDDLVDVALEDNPFYEPWMLLPAIKLLPDAHRTSCILVFNQAAGGANRLCGLFPVLEHSRYQRFPAKVLSLLWHRYVCSTVPLVDREAAQPTLACFLAWCLGAGVDLVSFPILPGDGAFHQALVDVLRNRVLLSRTEQRHNRACYRVPPDSAAYLSASLSGKARKHLRRSMERLRETGCVAYTSLEQHPHPEVWLENFLELESSGWKGRAGTALTSLREDREYFMQVALSGLAERRVFGSALYLDGRMIAARTAFAAGPGSYLFKIAYLDDYASYSPGNLLELQAIEHGIPEGISWTDSSTTPENTMYRRLWKDLRTVEHLTVATGSLKGEAALITLPVAQWLRRRIRGLRSR